MLHLVDLGLKKEWKLFSDVMSYHGGSGITKGLAVSPSALWLTLTGGPAPQ